MLILNSEIHYEREGMNTNDDFNASISFTRSVYHNTHLASGIQFLCKH